MQRHTKSVAKISDTELTDKQKAFLDALYSPECKGNYRKAMTIAGYDEKLAVNVVVNQLKDHIIERGRAYLAFNIPSAVAGLEEVLADPTVPGNKEKLAAAREFLDRTGLVKKQDVEVASSAPVGIFILPPKEDE